jgi:hypothetical protein
MEKLFFFILFTAAFHLPFSNRFVYEEVRQVTDRNKCNAKDSCLQGKNEQNK